jgi:hypothetical protein
LRMPSSLPKIIYVVRTRPLLFFSTPRARIPCVHSPAVRCPPRPSWSLHHRWSHLLKLVVEFASFPALRRCNQRSKPCAGNHFGHLRRSAARLRRALPPAQPGDAVPPPHIA